MLDVNKIFYSSKVTKNKNLLMSLHLFASSMASSGFKNLFPPAIEASISIVPSARC